jgi:hypothetical protein
MLKSQLLRSSAPLSTIPPAAYNAMSTALSVALRSGAYVKPAASEETEKASAAAVNPLMDPSQMDGMMDGLKKQAVMMVPNMVIMQWINTFFSGFVLSKLIIWDRSLIPAMLIHALRFCTDSQASFPPHVWFQGDAAKGYRHAGYGREIRLGVVLVLFELVWFERALQADARIRKWYE